MTFIRRYELDSSAPTRSGVWRDVARRALLPGLFLWLGLMGVGFLIVGPLGGLPAEAGINEALAAARTPFLNTATATVSLIGSTEFVIGLCALVIGLVWWRTKEWWYALVPGLAVALQAVVFMSAAAIVGRERPEAEHLDAAPPTSSFPSGHTGAAAAVYFTFAMMAQRIANPWLRWLVTIVCLAKPFAMGFSRLYRGMHSFTDVLFGFLNGVACAWLAWRYLRRDVEAGARRLTAN